MKPEEISATILQASQEMDRAMRRLNPLNLPMIREELLLHLEPLRTAHRLLVDATSDIHDEMVRTSLSRACDFLEGAIKTFGNEADMQAAFISALRAGRKHCRALEALYPLCSAFPEIDRYFSEEGYKPALPSETNVSSKETGITHTGANQDRHARGGYSLYVPESYTLTEPLPLIIALHGGYSHGRDFIWTWLAHARSRRYILFAPTSKSMTWSIMQAQTDGQLLLRHLDEVFSRFCIDPSRILLTGMSDGGTYALKLALSEYGISRHVASVACALPPVDFSQVQGKRILWIHGRQDWIFPVSYAVEAGKDLKRAGADIELKIISDLSHAYPREENTTILDWFETVR